MISAGHYLAANVGFQILEAGGNAVDAGVAAGITLSVVQSDFVSFAGVAPILIYLANRRSVVSISGLGWWPRAASLDFFLKNFGGSIPAGILRTVVPAAPDAWITALEHYGTMNFGDVAASAIRLAREGFVMYPLMAEMISSNKAGYARWESSRQVYLPEGRPPKVGEIFRQIDLAHSLQYMADEERSASSGGRRNGLLAARNAFYRGDIGRTIVDYHTRHAGFLSMRDLDEFSVEIAPSTTSTFGTTTLHSCGFWCQGPALLQALNMAEAANVGTLNYNSPDYLHIITEITKLAFADREAFFGDPRRVGVPSEKLLSKSYAAERVATIDPTRAISGLPRPGIAAKSVWMAAAASHDDEGADPTVDTSYVAVVDRHGNAFSATPSDASNNMPVIPGTGLCPSSRGSQSWGVAGHPAAIAPGCRPRLTPNPFIAIEADGSIMPFGTPGGDMQSQAMLQTFLNVRVFGMDLQSAVEAPRFATFSFPGSFEPHEVQLDLLMIEEPLAAAVASELAGRGHDAQCWPQLNWRAGGVCAIRLDQPTGVLTAGADPRRPSYALGW
ncbi:gamma-glutamyltranspeptidase/glutathione hydrolase [Rhodoligotrophos appendicifer]|uniref:gamma-glutamyltransferase family protein n=1 Tax=Rhodoligotrophos appendicifer TaxID=987056 RepID=UPI00195FB9E5|nr:gamma-glutamyltransferase [Rhodoligotrophos appendicifer]